MNIREELERIPLLSMALPPTKAKIISYAVTKKVKKGEFIFHAREQVDGIYIISKGYAVLEKINKNNDKRAVFILSNGSILNEVILSDPVASIDCYALTDLELIYFSRQHFLEIMQSDFGFTKCVVDSMSKKIRRLYRQIENTTKMMKLDYQVSFRLWKLARDFGVQKETYITFPFDITITFLSELVGSNRESVSRSVKKLNEAGLVSIKNGKCKIYNLDSLKNIEK